MIKIENLSVYGFEEAIRGMRNPKNSWEKSDSGWMYNKPSEKYIFANQGYHDIYSSESDYYIGPNDQDLMLRLAKGGPVHAKYRRYIDVYVDITAPLYW